MSSIGQEQMPETVRRYGEYSNRLWQNHIAIHFAVGAFGRLEGALRQDPAVASALELAKDGYHKLV